VRPSDHDSDVVSLSDSALVQETLVLRSRVGCQLVGLGVLVSLSLAVWLGPWSGLAALVCSMGLVALGLRVRANTPARRRAHAAERELGRRYSWEPLSEHLPEARAQLAADPGLAVLALFRGRMLPHGGVRSMRLEIGAQPKLQLRSCPMLDELQRGTLGSAAIVNTELPLTAAQVEHLGVVLRELSSAPLEPLASFVIDGFPCEASVLQRGAAELHTSVNLAGLPEQLKQHPSVRLIELFLDLEAEVFSEISPH
jgi:hypothetical protein